MQVSREQERQWQDTILPPLHVFVEFYHDEVVDIQASNLTDERVTKNTLLIKKKVKGDRFSLITSEAKESDIKQYPNEYNQYLRTQNDNQESNNQESRIGDSGGFEQTTNTNRPADKREQPVKRVDFGHKARRPNSVKKVQKRWRGIRRGAPRQVFNNQSPSEGFGINFGTFIL